MEPWRDAAATFAPSHEPDVRLTDAGFRGLVEHIPAISYITDFAPGFPLSYLSPQIERILGYPVQAFLDDQDLWYRILHPDDVEPMRAGELRTLATGEAVELEFRMFAADGRMFWFQELQTVVLDASGTPWLTQGVLVDVTSRKEARAALEDSERLNRSVVSALEEGVVVLDAAGTYLRVNASAARILGMAPEEMVGRSAPVPGHTLFYEDGSPVVRQTSAVERALTDGLPARDVIYRLIRPDGSEAWVSASYVPLRREGEDQPHGLVCSLVDITARRRADEALRAERDRAQRYLDVASTMFLVLDVDGRIELINREGCELMGWTEAGVLGQDWFELALPEHARATARAVFDRMMAGEIRSSEFSEYPVMTGRGQERIVAWHNAVIRDEAGHITGSVGSGEDITDRRQAELQIAYLAYHDPLTDLPNRALLEEHLDLALARARRTGRAIALLYLDLDDFKLVNDGFGHAAGDQVLVGASQRLRACTRADDLLARQGGDEFLMLLTDLGEQPERQAESVAHKLADVLGEPFELEGAEFLVGVSIGISVFPRDAGDADALLRHADAAMYQAKRSGRGRATVYAGPTHDPLERLSLTTRLRRAIEHDDLVLHYQPIFSLPERAPSTFEALVRWRDPERGLVRPGDFIPLAEESGLIDAIGEWVIDTLCREQSAMAVGGIVPRLAFNISPRQLRSRGFLTTLSRALTEHRVDPATLTAEITENTPMLDSDLAETVLHELRALGLSLALDDFGAGYSSLDRVRRLPFTVLKVDRSFMREIPGNDGARAIVTSVVSLARSLGIKAVAEGVETAAQLDFVVDLGCPYAQGFLLARPMPAAEAQALLAGNPAAYRAV